ncbi:MAG: hypothetical protein AAF409_10495 [Pseudomonadota bacterium]
MSGSPNEVHRPRQGPKAAIVARMRDGSEHRSLRPSTGMAALAPSRTVALDLLTAR